MELEVIKIENLEYLPLYFHKIYANIVTDINEETKLLRYSSRLQSPVLRDFDPHKPICKIGLTKKSTNNI